MPTSPVAYPLGAPQITDTKISVDMAFSNPGRITKRLSDLTLQKFIAPELFGSPGTTTTSGAIIYDTITINELYTKNDIEQRGPSDEYPIVQGERGAPQVAQSEDWGGKFWMSDEAIRRNDRIQMDRLTTQLANTIVRKVNQRTVAVLDAVIASLGGAGVVPGHDWGSAELTGTSPTPMAERPFADIIAAQLAADVEELDYNYNVWIMNPQEYANLRIVYGPDLNTILEEAGISTFRSNRVTPGTAYAAVRGGVGFLGYEQMLQTETWREPATKKNWVQSSVLPIMGVTDPYAVKKVTGLAG
ncbi:major head protein [Mycobacterium phage Rem711]|uniref:Major capsid protein n=1 Tax=Mycobacterium phage Rem711 TaxID=2079285 RepID=A0A2K9VEV5_9CAUD|nr:major head protein [Mycobacterium phage Rem711]AUV60790.1 major capsid protein [Mycobacterium phage Rem711]